MTQRTAILKQLDDVQLFKDKIIAWADEQATYLVLDSNTHQDKYSSFDYLIAISAESELKLNNAKDAFKQLKTYYNKTNDYIFGALSYDLKNGLEKLSSTNYDGLQQDNLFFFQAKKIFIIKGNTLTIKYLEKYKDSLTSDFNSILAYKTELAEIANVPIKNSTSKQNYIQTVHLLKEHTQQGDIYEVNYCQEFYSKNSPINPLAVYQKLNRISKAPFASFFKQKENYILCSSPERFVKKTGKTIISQPIKGTAKRGKTAQEDNRNLEILSNDPKERAENVMIVDLVRNDMAKIALKGSVSVPELCKIYTFEQVHQMISTVTAQVSPSKDPFAIISALFPMGSMTGAPKIAAMQLIEKHENFKRGFYSGTIGYITPSGDFDFNVIIRSILYNAKNKYLSFSVGGAITNQSNAASEYKECMTKAKAMLEVLNNNI